MGYSASSADGHSTRSYKDLMSSTFIFCNGEQPKTHALTAEKLESGVCEATGDEKKWDGAHLASHTGLYRERD